MKHAIFYLAAGTVLCVCTLTIGCGQKQPGAASNTGPAGDSAKAHRDNIKQLALAFHSFASNYEDRFLPVAICDKDGKPLLSWRVAILPYIEEDALYRQFKLDEPWDSPNNKKLLEHMPKAYRLPGADAKETQTHYQVFVGANTLYPSKPPEGKPWLGLKAEEVAGRRGAVRGLYSPYRVGSIPDGTLNTILIVEAADSVPWTKPADSQYDPKNPLPQLGKLSPDGFYASMAEGSVHFVSNKVSEKTLRNAIDPNDGETLGPDWTENAK